MTTHQKQTLIKWICSILTITAASLAAAFGLSSCNVTRVITNESKYVTRGDTSIVIQSKTIETYDAIKKSF